MSVDGVAGVLLAIGPLVWAAVAVRLARRVAERAPADAASVIDAMLEREAWQAAVDMDDGWLERHEERVDGLLRVRPPADAGSGRVPRRMPEMDRLRG